MPRIDDHRKAAGENLEIFYLKPPFSFFDFIEDKFGDYDSIRQIFSLARSSLAKTLIIESIQPNGLISEENENILRLFPGYSNDDLLRISFWNKEITEDSIADMLSEVLIGYAIFKRDVVRKNNFDRWHVFEAVFSKYPHNHNCLPRPQIYHLEFESFSFKIEGLLYCQQNGLNKACAQVALRSLLSRILPEGDILTYNIKTQNFGGFVKSSSASKL